jgi:uncharacterized protein
MASTNQSPFYKRAEQDFLKATTDQERIVCLEIMIKECPKHKSSEKMLKNLTSRLKKLKEGEERKKKKSKSSNKQGIKKQDMQCVLIGFPNTGKSTIFNLLTNNNPHSQINDHPFTTNQPILGTINYEDTKIQIIDDSPVPNHDRSLINSTDTLLIIIDQLQQIKEMENQSWKSSAKKIYILNKTDKYNETELRKIKETIKSKHRNIKAFFFNKNADKNLTKELKKIIFETFPIIRIYTKEPGKNPSTEPMILKKDSTIKEAAEKILKGLSKKIKKTRIWGPSSKFGGQAVGINHILKDKDTIEFKIN